VNGSTRRLAAVVLALAVVSLAARNGRVLALALPLLVYLGADFFFRPDRLDLVVQRSLGTARCPAGSPVEVRLSVRNEGPLLAELLLMDEVPASLEILSGSACFFSSLPQGEAVEWSYTVQGVRGEHAWGGLRAEACGFCGTSAGTVTFPAVSRLLVLPEPFGLSPIGIRPRQTRGFAGPIQARVAGSGVLMYGVREYRMGDPLRRVNWRLTSRDPRTVYANEFEQERIADVGIIVDAREPSYAHPAGDALFESAVSAASSLADRFLADGNRVALLIYGYSMDRVPPGYGRAQAEKIRRKLAGARTGINFALESLGHLPTRLFPARSQLVVVSPLQSGDLRVLRALRASGYSLLIVSPDPDSAPLSGGESVPSALASRIVRLERAVAVGALRRAGVEVVDWRLDGNPAAALRAALTRRTAGPPAGGRL
jgi:uncharacterized protein (DUF58 family)